MSNFEILQIALKEFDMIYFKQSENPITAVNFEYSGKYTLGLQIDIIEKKIFTFQLTEQDSHTVLAILRGYWKGLEEVSDIDCGDFYDYSVQLKMIKHDHKPKEKDLINELKSIQKENPRKFNQVAKAIIGLCQD